MWGCDIPHSVVQCLTKGNSVSADFFMTTTQDEIASIKASITIAGAPIKGTADSQDLQIDSALIQRQADAVRSCLVSVYYREVRGSCIDERARSGLRSGKNIVEVRPSVPGGPNVYALAVAELTGYFSDSSDSGEERLARVTNRLNEGQIKSGGHEKCAANGGFNAWMQIVAEDAEAIKDYAREQLGEKYNESLFEDVIANARKVIAGGHYQDWNEDVLARVLEDQAGEAIEILADVPHEAVTFVRNSITGATIDHTKLYNMSIAGRGSFVNDEAYADVIEHIIASGPDAVRKKREAEHAREVILAAVAQAVPNKILYQIRLRPLS
jgi:hypothetical protein